MPPALPPLPPADRAEPAEAFDVFGTPTSHGTVENAAERTGRTPLPSRAVPEVPGSPLPHRAPPERHAVGPIGSGQPDEARPKPDLFGGDTGRTLAQPPAGRRDRTVAETGPHRTGRTGTPSDVSLFDSPTARVSSPSRPPGPPLRPIPPPTAGDPRRPVPLDLPPAGSDDVPLFGEAPAPTRGVPEGPAPDLPRTGRRRRPDADEPETAAPPATDVESSLLQQHRARPAGPAAGRARRPGTPPAPVPSSPYRRRPRRQRPRGQRPRGRRARCQRPRGGRARRPTGTARTGTTRTGTGRTVTARTGTGTARPATAPHPTCPADPRVGTFAGASRHLRRRESHG